MKPPENYDWEAVREEAKNFPTYPEYTKDDVKRVQARILEMGKTVSKILTDAGINHTLACGSLIGAVRHKGFIPWDDDIDFWVPDEEYDDALAALRENLPEDLIIHDESNDPIYWVEWSRVRDLKTRVHYAKYSNDRVYRYQGLCIDLYRLYKISDEDLPARFLQKRREGAEAKLERGIITAEEIKDYYKWFDDLYQRWFVEYEKRLYGELYTDNFYWAISKVEDFFPVTMVEFEDTVFPAPHNPVDVIDYLFEHIKWWELPPYEERVVHYSKVEFL